MLLKEIQETDGEAEGANYKEVKKLRDEAEKRFEDIEEDRF